MNCKRCNRPVRSRGELLKDHPGTVKSPGRQLCEPCHRAAWADGTLDTYPRTGTTPPATCCAVCEAPARADGVTAQEAPGTVRIKHGGLCHSCYAKRSHNGQARPFGPVAVESNRRTLDAYLARRRPNRLKLGTAW
jgi:hypothetical protein